MELKSSLLVVCCLEYLSRFSSIIASDDQDISLKPHFYFVEEPSGTVYGIRGGTICLHCSAVCLENGPVEISWRREDRADMPKRYNQMRNGTLCIERLRKSPDEGFYECLARHRIGIIVSRKVKVELARISATISVDPANISTYEGDSVRFRCIVSGSPWPVIDWERNGQKLTNDSLRVTVLNTEGVLQLVNVQIDDTGDYRCVARNSWNSTTSSTAALTVLPSENVTHQESVVLLGQPRNQDALLSQTVTLECFLSGRPSPPVVKWTKQGGAIKSDMRLFGSGNLEIKNIEESDEGTYVCEWINPDDHQIITAEANITVSVPPQFLRNNSMKLYTVKRREQVVRLSCRFYGQPQPQVTWFKNGQIVERTNRIKVDQNEMSITQTRATDTGIYQCRAENQAGIQQAMTLLHFESNEYSPFPPSALLMVSVNSTAIRFAWNDNQKNRDRNVSAYCVYITPTKGGKELQQVVPRSARQLGGSLVVEMLKPLTNYTAYVVAYNMHGGSEQSPEIVVATLEDVPLSFPLLHLHSSNTTSLRLKWDELSPDQARGIVTEYMILCRKHGMQNYEQKTVRPIRREYIVTGLEVNTKYDVMVAARTKIGYPPLTNKSLPWMTYTTKGSNQSDVPEAPEMNAVAIDNAAILVNWSSRNQGILVLGYKLLCRISRWSSGGTAERAVTVGADVKRHLFSGLEPSTVYQVQIVAFNNRGDSQATTQMVKTTGGTRARVSSSLIVNTEVINSTSVVISWTRPTLTGNAEYVVRYWPVDAVATSAKSNATAFKSVNSITERVVVHDLIPFTTYEFSVEAAGSQSIVSEPVRCQTLEGVPSAPLDLDVTLVGQTSVDVQWNPPTGRNGIIINYLVLYTLDFNWPSGHWFTKVENGSTLSTSLEDLKPNSFYSFRVLAVTNAGRSLPSEVVHINTGSTSSEGLTDQELGIIIGTSIGLTCIIICTCVLLLRNKFCPVTRAPVASAEGHIANGSVTACRCHPVDCTAEFHVLHPNAEIDAHNHQMLIENRNCDTKGGNNHNGRNQRYNCVRSNGQLRNMNSTHPMPSKHEENANQVVPLLDEDGKAYNLENIVDLDGIDYEDQTEINTDNTDITTDSGTYESDRSQDKVMSDGVVQHRDKLLGGQLPSRNHNGQVCPVIRDQRQAVTEVEQMTATADDSEDVSIRVCPDEDQNSGVAEKTQEDFCVSPQDSTCLELESCNMKEDSTSLNESEEPSDDGKDSGEYKKCVGENQGCHKSDVTDCDTSDDLSNLSPQVLQ